MTLTQGPGRLISCRNWATATLRRNGEACSMTTKP